MFDFLSFFELYVDSLISFPLGPPYYKVTIVKIGHALECIKIIDAL